ncbi:MAG: cyanophycinase [Cyclobacteriaceae bacterium]|jgi:cyanophycinase|nr:cyanophycinase [Cyclobacteriaceae bacterium]
MRALLSHCFKLSLLVIIPFISSGQQSITLSQVSIGISGSASDVSTSTEAGFVLGGGGKDVEEAMKWMIERSGGGDFVIIRSTGSTGYNDYLYEMGGLNSVETLLIDSREKAMSKEVGQRICEAEALFIAGGDQWNYVNYWKDSEVSEAIQYLINKKKIPIGGTSAGCAVLSEYIFDARHDTAVSADALAHPYVEQVSVSKSFINIPFLVNTIADQHYSQRERQGRHLVFMARMIKDFQVAKPKGIAADERTAVCIDKKGNATVFGSGNAFFLMAKSSPEVCEVNKPLEWNNNQKAIEVYTFQASLTGTPAFNLLHWPTDKPNEYWFVSNGQLQRIKN